MPLFGANDEIKTLTRECYKSMNGKYLAKRELVWDQFCTEFSTELRQPCYSLYSEKSYVLDDEPYSREWWNLQRLAMSVLVAYVDGGSFGNPGPSGIGVVIDPPEGSPIRISKWIGHQDNNVAEYLALLEALQCALTLNASALQVFSDSQVVVRQMRGEYSCRSPRLYSLNWICRKLARSLSFSIDHVARENNMEANRLANAGARRQSS
jgi:ribonuclease HI